MIVVVIITCDHVETRCQFTENVVFAQVRSTDMFATSMFPSRAPPRSSQGGRPQVSYADIDAMSTSVGGASSSGGRSRSKGSGGVTVGTFAPKRSRVPASDAPIAPTPITTVPRGSVTVSPMRPITSTSFTTRSRPEPSRFDYTTPSVASNSRPQGSISLSNATSKENPLATSSYQTMDRRTTRR